MKIESRARFIAFISGTIAVVSAIVLGVSFAFGWVQNPFSHKANFTVAPKEGETKTVGETTETREMLSDAEVVFFDEGSVVVRFTGKNTVEIDGKKILVQEAATVFYTDETKFKGLSKNDLTPGKKVDIDTVKKVTGDETRFEAMEVRGR